MERRAFFKLAGFSAAAFGAGFAMNACDAASTRSTFGVPEKSEGDFAVGQTPISFSTQVDVLIVGSGVAGLSAAMAPSEAGLSTMVADKQSLLGGEAYESGGLMYAVGTDLQRKAGLTLSLEDAWKERKKELDAAGVKDLVFAERLFCEAREWVNYLQSNYRAQFSDPSTYAKPGVNEFFVLPRNGLGDMEGIMIPWRDKLQAQGVKFQSDYLAQAFILDKDGVVCGMRFLTESSQSVIDVKAKRIVIATGGFASSQPLIFKYAPSWVRLGSYTHESMGEGQLLCRNAGGKLENMDGPLPLTSDLPQVSAWPYFAPVVGVDSAGRRFAREDRPCALPEACFVQEGGYWWSIFDKRMSSCSQSRSLAQVTSKNGKRVVGPCDSLDELARAMGVRTDVLEETFTRYDKAVEAQKDEDFGKTLNLDKLEAPYYAIRQQPVRYRTRGGVVVTDSGCLVGTSGKTILNVYCCGAVTSRGGEGLTTNGAHGMLVGQEVVRDLSRAKESSGQEDAADKKDSGQSSVETDGASDQSNAEGSVDSAQAPATDASSDI